MPSPTPARWGPLQLAVLRSLWRRGTATVNDVHADLRDRDLALTTVATVLRRMEAAGAVSHSVAGRQFVYRAAVAEADVAGSETGAVLDRLFSGRLAGLVSHVLASRDVSADELDELSKLIAAKRRAAGRRTPPGSSP